MSLKMYFFFFSSRRRHTRLQGDWSSDVCSSDLHALRLGSLSTCPTTPLSARVCAWRSEERRVGKSVDLGGRRIIKKKKKTEKRNTSFLKGRTCASTPKTTSRPTR